MRAVGAIVVALWFAGCAGVPVIPPELQEKIERDISFQQVKELPEFTSKRPDGKIYHFFGGHRLWLAPEVPLLSYALDDRPVEILHEGNDLLLRKAVEPETGFEKSIRISTSKGEAKITLHHTLLNKGATSVKYAAWAITQFTYAFGPGMMGALRDLAASRAITAIYNRWFLRPLPSGGRIDLPMSPQLQRSLELIGLPTE